MLKIFTLLFLIVVASFVSAEEAYFKFRYEYAPRDGEFVFKLIDPKKIYEARSILSGAQREEVHVMGRIIKRYVHYNPRWDFHLDPSTIQFFRQAIEVCDASINYTNDHLDEACGAFLPGCLWCPWVSVLTGEVDPYSASAHVLFQKDF